MIQSNPTPHPHRLGLPWWAVIGLAALAVPRVVVHDVGATVGPLAMALLTLGPPLVWVAVCVVRRVPSPVLTLVAVGTCYGVALAVLHNLMWGRLLADRLEASLAGPGVLAGQELFVRAAMSVSSLFTGMVVGLLAGLLATVVRRVVPVPAGRRPSRPGQ